MAFAPCSDPTPKFKRTSKSKILDAEQKSLLKDQKNSAGLFHWSKGSDIVWCPSSRSGVSGQRSRGKQSGDNAEGVQKYIAYTSDEESLSDNNSESHGRSSAESDVGHECILFSGSKNQRTRCRAEVFISELLGCILPGEYDPERHWTS